MTWHLVTGEYPPTIGGVADHTRLLAEGLVRRGLAVHVWCPGNAGVTPERGVAVHRVAGAWSGADRARVDAMMTGASPGPILVQWVPHAYGRKSLNAGFCRWIWRVARGGRPVELIVHEPFLAFADGNWKQDAAAVAHRGMIAMLLRAATRVWISIPAWEDRIRPWLFGREIPVRWLPVPSNVTPEDAPREVAALRARLLGDNGSRVLIGHFGTFGKATRAPLLASLERVLARDPGVTAVLVGRDGSPFREDLVARVSGAAQRVHATGALPGGDVSRHLQACDLLVQPYIDGASTRRGTLMAALAHGLPTVTSVGRLSEPLWALEHERSVIVVPADDHEALAGAVLRLAGDAAARARLGRGAKALYEAQFSIDRVLDRLLLGREAA